MAPERFRRRQKRAGGARRGQEVPDGARRGQKGPGGARRGQKGPEGARRGQKGPEGLKRGQPARQPGSQAASSHASEAVRVPRPRLSEAVRGRPRASRPIGVMF